MSAAAIDWKALDRHWNCKLTVRGRKSGKERTVTIWYAVGDGQVFLTGGPDNPQWARNAAANPDVVVQIGGQRLRGRARVVAEGPEAESIRKRFTQRYVMARISKLFGGYTKSVAVVVGGLAPA
jgi:deazaflavin-dependent oxidoreductase (nitroreductase family)